MNLKNRALIDILIPGKLCIYNPVYKALYLISKFKINSFKYKNEFKVNSFLNFSPFNNNLYINPKVYAHKATTISPRSPPTPRYPTPPLSFPLAPKLHTPTHTQSGVLQILILKLVSKG